jgi:predicted nucleic acid-binding protein
LNELTSVHARLFTTNLVLVETHALVLARLRRPDLAARIITELYNSKQTLLVRATEADERRALTILTRYQDKAFSFTDATSFAVMERLRIQYAFSFDTDFQQYGWIVLQPPTR